MNQASSHYQQFLAFQQQYQQAIGVGNTMTDMQESLNRNNIGDKQSVASLSTRNTWFT